MRGVPERCAPTGRAPHHREANAPALQVAPGQGRHRFDQEPRSLPRQPRPPARERSNPQAGPPTHQGLPGYTRGTLKLH